MRTETIQIKDLPADTMQALVDRARQAGTTPEEIARRLIEEGLSPKDLSFDEILAPFRRQVEQSGVTDDELDALFTRARKEVFRENKEKEQTRARTGRSCF
ncbi:MAG: hypothetical protein AABN33_13575 [Acidobacteriota bacterium]